MKKKLLTAIALSIAAVALVAASILGTIAYLTASSAVSNVFTVGDVNITMFETKVDTSGVPVSPKVEVDTNSYHLMPGATYTKDPTIRILSKFESDEMYLFVKSSNQIREIEAANVENPAADAPKSMRQQMEDNGWIQLVKSGDGIEIVWVYGTRAADGTITPTPVNPTTKQVRGDSTIGPEGEIRLCENFTIDKNVKNISLYGAAKVSFTAFAIQTTGLDTAADAWEAIKATYPYEGGILNPVNPYDLTMGAYEKVPTKNED